MNLPRSAIIYIGVVVSLTVLAVYFSVQQFPLELDLHFIQALAIFAFFSFLAQVYEVELVYKRTTSTTMATMFAAILLGGPILAIGATFVSTFIAEIFLRWCHLRTGRIDFLNFLYRVIFNTSQVLLSTLGAAIVFLWLGGQPLMSIGDSLINYLPFGWGILPAIGAFLVYSVTNTAFVSGIISLTQKTEFAYHFRFNLKYILIQILSLGVLGILMAVLYVLSPWNLLLLLIPLGLVHVSLRNYMKLRHEAKKTFERVAKLLSDRDPYTYEHSNEVAELAEMIARKLKLHQDLVEKIKDAATIHDIGKLGIPDKILNKPGPLTNEEWQIMKKHPEIGAELLKDLEIFADIIDIVLYEHERWDGSGYPKSLKGKEIPLGARIVAVADVYNALVTDRPYRKAFSQEEALKMMREMRGVKLDPEVVDALFGVLEDAQAAAARPAYTPTKAIAP